MPPNNARNIVRGEGVCSIRAQRFASHGCDGDLTVSLLELPLTVGNGRPSTNTLSMRV